MNSKEYKLALSNADSIDYQRYDVEMERKWDIQREYWVDKVLEEASKNGVELEYTPGPDVDRANRTKTESTGFVKGFKDIIDSGLDNIKESIDGFNSIISNVESTNR